MRTATLEAAAPELLEACKLFQAALTEYKLRDVRKRFSLCIADAAASKAIAKAEGRYTPDATGNSELAEWMPAKVGCHWTHPKYPSAIVSSIVKRSQDGAQFSGYVAVVNFAEIGTFHTRQLAQQAVEAHLGA